MNIGTHISQRNWENASKVKLLNLQPYRHLFPKATGKDWTVKRNAGVSHTVKFIPQAVKLCSWQVENFVKQELRHLALEEACRKLWWWVRFHIQWVKDAENKEQVKSPRRLVSDGKGDCDCMTTFVDTCLRVYGVKSISNRIVAYDGKINFSHIYTVVHKADGSNIIIDCCFPAFNQEKRYTKKEDHNMDLQFLDGIEDTSGNPKGSNTEVVLNDDIMGELGRLLKRHANKSAAASRPVINKAPLINRRNPEQKQAAKENRQTKINNAGKKTIQVVNKVNKVNPATVLFRAGFLASMKLNILKVAERIKWGYASPQLAASKGMDMTKYQKVKDVLVRAQKLFFAAGGKAESLRAAIMTGKGNQNRELSGQYEFDEKNSLTELLGEVYLDEFVSGMEGIEGLESLGEPATAASISAAAGAMGALAALLASIGTLFPKKEKVKTPKAKPQARPKRKEPAPAPKPAEEEGAGNEEIENQTNPAEETESNNESAEEQAEASEEENSDTESNQESTSETSQEESPEAGTEGLNGVLLGLKTYYEKNKDWIKPVAAAGTGFLAGYLTHSFLCSCNDKAKNSNSALYGLNQGGVNGEEDLSKGVIALM